mgnify:CR=1 FL=1
MTDTPKKSCNIFDSFQKVPLWIFDSKKLYSYFVYFLKSLLLPSQEPKIFDFLPVMLFCIKKTHLFPDVFFVKLWFSINEVTHYSCLPYTNFLLVLSNFLSALSGFLPAISNLQLEMYNLHVFNETIIICILNLCNNLKLNAFYCTSTI